MRWLGYDYRKKDKMLKKQKETGGKETVKKRKVTGKMGLKVKYIRGGCKKCKLRITGIYIHIGLSNSRENLIF